MKMPFTTEQFLEVFKSYNQAVFPIQFIFYLFGIIALGLIFKPITISGKLVSAILAFFWLWMGIVYQLTFFATINKAAYIFGIAFILQGVLLFWLGVFQNKLSFRFYPDQYGITGAILVFFALIVYPILNYSYGHVYPYSPTFGLPCPTTIFTFGILLLSDKRCPTTILIIPFIWAIVGFTAAFNFGIVEDTGLLISGLIAFLMLLLRNRMLARKGIAN